MSRKNLTIFLAAAGAIFLCAANGYTHGSYCDSFTGTGCNGCHSTPGTNNWPACPAPAPTCTDNDGDGFSIEGGDCGLVDCNDSNANVNPAATEIANNGIDDNCDGVSLVDTTILDGDGDGYTPAQGDCNDNNPAINPAATENCTDGIDNNCNNLIDAADSSAVGCPPVCTDGDGDGFALEGGACGPVDCNDKNASINPNATDIPNNGIDEDCSGADSVDPTALDKDGDGYTPAQGDCDDTNPAINPGAVDVANNGIDENCDGADTVDNSVVDNDNDGFTPAAGDCDDSNAAINPNASENCTDGIDNNCNGLVDTQDPDAVDCPVTQTCTDNDGDTYAVEGGGCGPVDCDDSDVAVSPGSEEVCGDNIDNDCDGDIDEGCDAACPDADGDGYLDAACGGTDCNDSDAAINPAAAEDCGNGIDENCNGASDDICLSCPDGSLLEVRMATYRYGALQVSGSGKTGTTITITDTDTGAVLADRIPVRYGRWQASIDELNQTPESISATTSEGCTVDQQVTQNRRDDEHRSYQYQRGDDDHEYQSSYRTRYQSSRRDD